MRSTLKLGVTAGFFMAVVASAKQNTETEVSLSPEASLGIGIGLIILFGGGVLCCAGYICKTFYTSIFTPRSSTPELPHATAERYVSPLIT